MALKVDQFQEVPPHFGARIDASLKGDELRYKTHGAMACLHVRRSFFEIERHVIQKCDHLRPHITDQLTESKSFALSCAAKTASGIEHCPLKIDIVDGFHEIGTNVLLESQPFRQLPGNPSWA